MNRKNKNIIMCLILVVLIVISAITIKFSSDNKVKGNNNRPNFSEGDFPNIPEDFDKDNLPDRNEKSSDSDKSSERKRPSNGERPNMEDFDGKNFNRNNKFNKISTSYYVLFGIEGLAIGCVIAYLIMSNFNKKDYKETFKGNDKKIIYILYSLAIGALMFGCDSLIAKNIKKNNTKNIEQKFTRKDRDDNKENNNSSSNEKETKKTKNKQLDSEEYNI